MSCTLVLVIRLEQRKEEGKGKVQITFLPFTVASDGPCPPPLQRTGWAYPSGMWVSMQKHGMAIGKFSSAQSDRNPPIQYQLKWCTYFKAVSRTSLSLQFIKHFDTFNSICVLSLVFELWFCQEFSSREENLMREISVPWSQCHTMRIRVICQGILHLLFSFHARYNGALSMKSYLQ